MTDNPARDIAMPRSRHGCAIAIVDYFRSNWAGIGSANIKHDVMVERVMDIMFERFGPEEWPRSAKEHTPC